MTVKHDSINRLRGRTRWSYLAVPEGSSLHLDIGCDRGDLACLYAIKSRVVVAIDLDYSLLRDANKKYLDVHFIIASADVLPFKDCSFQTITMTDLLEHTSMEEVVISETARILMQTGTLIFSVPHKGLFDFLDPFNFNRLFPKKLFLFLYKFFKRTSYNVKNLTRPMHRHYNLKELRCLFHSNFIVKKVHRGGCIFFYFDWFFSETFYKILPQFIGDPIMRLLSYISHLEYNVDFGFIAAHLNMILIKK